MGIERCGKINAMNSGPESCTGIGVVAGLFIILLIREQLREKHERPTPEVQIWAIIQVVKETPKTRNHLIAKDATILAMGEGGMRTLRKGSNEFSCMVIPD